MRNASDVLGKLLKVVEVKEEDGRWRRVRIYRWEADVEFGDDSSDGDNDDSHTAITALP